MPMVLDDIKAVVSLMRSQGVSAFKLDDLEVTFSPVSEVPAESGSMDALPTEAPLEISDEEKKRLDDELLFHSAV